jgi:hypothetical protein
MQRSAIASLVLGFVMFAMTAPATWAESKQPAPKHFVCNSEFNFCICKSQQACKDMLGMCKDRTMECSGDLCSCTRARVTFDRGIKPPVDQGAAVNGRVNN